MKLRLSIQNSLCWISSNNVKGSQFFDGVTRCNVLIIMYNNYTNDAR